MRGGGPLIWPSSLKGCVLGTVITVVVGPPDGWVMEYMCQPLLIVADNLTENCSPGWIALPGAAACHCAGCSWQSAPIAIVIASKTNQQHFFIDQQAFRPEFLALHLREIAGLNHNHLAGIDIPSHRRLD